MKAAKTISGPIRLLVNEGQGVFFEVTVKNHDTGKLHRFTDVYAELRVKIVLFLMKMQSRLV